MKKMPPHKCPVCKCTADRCNCQQICKTCLSNGNLSEDGGCQCLSAPQVSSQKNENTHRSKPPSLGMLKDKSNLQIYLAGLKRWTRIGGVPAKEQADTVLMNGMNEYPELYLEMENLIGDKVSENVDGIEEIITFLNGRFGVDKTADLMRTFNKFCKFKRASDQEYISFVQTFESNYNEFKKLGEELSGMFLSLFLLSRANLPEIDYQIITSGLDFQSKTVYEDTKSALKKQQYSKDVKSQEKPEASKSAIL